MKHVACAIKAFIAARASLVDQARRYPQVHESSDQKMVGNFTACALLSKEPSAEAEAMKKAYGLSCE